ncbi:MAG: phosphoribosylanthranilate isomerase [Catalinimonas sp.]
MPDPDRDRPALEWKVCGMRDATSLRALAPLRPDYVGLIFFSGSRRYVGADFDPAVLDVLPAATQRVGVFVNAPLDEMTRVAERYALDALQLHGDEPPATCRALRAAGHTVFKAFGVEAVFDFARLDAYAPHVDLFLFDTKGPARGGNGVAFDWSVLARYRGKVPFLLSGGIGPESVAALRAFQHPAWRGIDVNSRFEVEPGVKDVVTIGKFVDELSLHA